MHPVSPEEVGMSSPRLQRIGAHLQRYVDRQLLPGTVTLVARHGKVAYADCRGKMDLASDKPLQLDTIFRIASMTKPITTVAAMMLYEEGHFLLSDSVSRYIPELRGLKVIQRITSQGLELGEPQREVTIRDLLVHTSGLVSPQYPPESPITQMYQKLTAQAPGGTLQAAVAKLGELPLAEHPGSKWQYGLSTDVLGYLVEVISGMSLDRFFQDRIFAPLGLVDTGFHVPPEQLHRLPSAYTPAEGGIALVDAPETSWLAHPPTYFSGGGGLVSTVADYLRFCQMLLNRGVLDTTRLLSRKTVELMMRNHLPPELTPISSGPGRETDTAGCGFGLGFAVLLDLAQAQILGSEGTLFWGGAYSTAFWIDPQEELIGIFMTQLTPSNTYPIRREVRLLAYQAIAD
ncbi:MAG: class A beta-lactamase-related serine hydrolase [Chloroflexi bacterium]|nr:class A beta-lactamase-related serine hydrolase [Chloroflexota bacterium]